MDAPLPGLRGNYDDSVVDADYVVRPHLPITYSAAEHARWAQLFAMMREIVPGRVVPEVEAGIDLLAELGAETRIPEFAAINARLRPATGWQIVPVPGLLPAAVFFRHLARRSFPVTLWLRRADEMEYLSEPDIFHDFFGHLALLFQPTFSSFVHAFGQRAAAAEDAETLLWVTRLYWHTVEFGLMDTPSGLRIYGAGITSSAKETVYAVESPAPLRLRFDLGRVMRSMHEIDDLQRQYFVINSYQELFDSLEGDWPALLAAVRARAEIPIGTILPTDRLVPPPSAGMPRTGTG